MINKIIEKLPACPCCGYESLFLTFEYEEGKREEALKEVFERVYFYCYHEGKDFLKKD